MNSQNKLFPIFVLTFLAIIWGSSFILIKKGLDVYSPDQVGTIRIVFAALALLPFALKNLQTAFKSQWKLFLLFGVVSNLTPALLFAVAETGLSSSITGILNSLTPIFTLIVGALFFSTQIQKSQIFGLVIGFAGSLALSFIGSGGELGEFNFYALFVVAATICYGFSANMVRKYFLKVEPVVLTALAVFAVGPFSLIYLLTTDFTTRLTNVDGAWLSLFYLFILGAVGTAFALILFNRVIQTTSAVFASTVTYLIPIAAVIWGLIDNEALYPMHFIGMALIILGVFVVNKNK